MKKIKAIIVEDEELAVRNLLTKLDRNCPQVEVIATCSTAESAIQEISKSQADLVFLDIELGGLNGFDVLHRLKYIKFEVIFITNMREYAVKAFRLDALDFLEKPIDENELSNAVIKVWQKLENPATKMLKLSVPIHHGARFLSIDEILYCEADNNRTIFHLFNREKLVASKVLKLVEKQLLGYGFIRIHRSYLINRDYLEEFNRTDGGFVIMSNGDRLPVAKVKFSLLSAI